MPQCIGSTLSELIGLVLLLVVLYFSIGILSLFPLSVLRHCFSALCCKWGFNLPPVWSLPWLGTGFTNTLLKVLRFQNKQQKEEIHFYVVKFAIVFGYLGTDYPHHWLTLPQISRLPPTPCWCSSLPASSLIFSCPRGPPISHRMGPNGFIQWLRALYALPWVIRAQVVAPP